MWFIHAGREIGPTHFQVSILYGAVNVDSQHGPEYRIVWPIDKIPDTEGGTDRLRPDNTLNHFTATSGPEIFRGDRLPEELVGDLFFGEPVGTLYIVDMYRGIIQEGTWMQRDSYLYGVAKDCGLDRNVGRGRIWRLRQ